MQHHPSGRQGGLDGRRVSVITQCRQHVSGDAAGAGTSRGLVGTLATGVGFEIAAQHSFARAGNVRCPNHEIEVGRACYKYHQCAFLGQGAKALPRRRLSAGPVV